MMAPRCPALQFVPAKVFIGGCSTETTNEGLGAYCGQWYACLPQLNHLHHHSHQASVGPHRPLNWPQVLPCRGEVADCHVMTGKGYAFVTFREVPSAQAFLEVR
jgi:hypothetical protein